MKCGSVPFMYLIQDYETVFHPRGSLSCLAEATYRFNFNAFFSSSALQQFLNTKCIGAFQSGMVRSTFFNNACARSLPSKSNFIRQIADRKVKRLAFYSRPVVDRNMFELGALALCIAFSQGVFAEGEWQFFGIGLGDAIIRLDSNKELQQLPRMNLAEYQQSISSFDVGLCLMASSHPSLLPFDLAGSGAVVVTNSFEVKDQAYFDDLVKGVLVCEPDVDSLVEALRIAAINAFDLDSRFEKAKNMNYPSSWDHTFTYLHADFVKKAFARTSKERSGR